MEYVIVKDGYGDIEICDSCFCEVPVGVFYDKSKAPRILCELCATTGIAGITSKWDNPDCEIARVTLPKDFGWRESLIKLEEKE